jgi:hypothetical protein
MFSGTSSPQLYETLKNTEDISKVISNNTQQQAVEHPDRISFFKDDITPTRQECVKAIIENKFDHVILQIGDKKFDADGNHERVFIVYDIPYKNSSVSGQKTPELNEELNAFNNNVKRMQNCISVYNILNPVFMSKILGESTTICLPTWISIETLTHKKTKESLKSQCKIKRI